MRRRWKVAAGAVAVLAGLSGIYAEYEDHVGRTTPVRFSQAQVADHSSGRVETRSFRSASLSRKMRYVVYLPPGYDDPRNAGASYPVVYLLHGSTGEPEDWVRSGQANATADALIRSSRLQPTILVMVQGNLDGETGEDELRAGGPDGAWSTYVTRDLVGEVDHEYRTVASREGRALAGLSEGGYGAANMGLKNGDEFSVVGSFSGYFAPFPDDKWLVSGADDVRGNSPMEYLKDLHGPLPAVYASIGKDDDVLDLREQNLRFARVMDSVRGLDHEFHQEQGGHDWGFWKGQLGSFLVFAGKRLKGGR